MVELHQGHRVDETPLEETFAEIQRRLRLVVDSKHEEIPGFCNGRGLCRNCYWEAAIHDLEVLDEQALDRFRAEGMQAWGEYSGSPDYPVSCPLLPGNIREAQNAYDGTWDLYAGEYGAARRRLAAHLLAWNEQHKAELFLKAEVRRAG